jgi:flagellar basal body-associated protein FliL
MSDENPEGAAEGEAKPAKVKGPSKLPLLLTVVNLAATGFLVFRSLTVVPHAAPADGHGGAHAKAEKPVPGPVVTLDPFVVNLRDEGSSRYLKTSFEVELDKAETLPELEAQKRAVRDTVLRYLSNLTVADTLGEEAKDKITAGIMARINKELGEGKAKKLYFTDFVIQ